MQDPDSYAPGLYSDSSEDEWSEGDLRSTGPAPNAEHQFMRLGAGEPAPLDLQLQPLHDEPVARAAPRISRPTYRRPGHEIRQRTEPTGRTADFQSSAHMSERGPRRAVHSGTGSSSQLPAFESEAPARGFTLTSGTRRSFDSLLGRLVPRFEDLVPASPAPRLRPRGPMVQDGRQQPRSASSPSTEVRDPGAGRERPRRPPTFVAALSIDTGLVWRGWRRRRSCAPRPRPSTS